MKLKSSNIKPPEGLFNKIMARIREEERLISVRRRLFAFSVSAAISAGAFIPATSVFKFEFAQSDLAQFMPLLWSDWGIVMGNWRDFSLAILESLPAISISAFLLALFVFLWSLKHLILAIQNANIKMQNFGIASR